MQGVGFMVQGLGVGLRQKKGEGVPAQLGRVQGSGFRVQGAGCRLQGAGFRVQGAGFRAQGQGGGVGLVLAAKLTGPYPPKKDVNL